MRARSSTLSKLAAVAAALTLVAGAYFAGLFEQLAEPERAAASIAALGAYGYLGFILSYALLQPFGIPGTVFVIAASLIWEWPLAFLLSLIGTMAASVVGFSFSRFVARDWISARIPAKFRKYDRALEQRAFVTVVILRLIFWMPPLLHASFGVSKVRFWTHFWGSLVGYLLPLLLLCIFGQRLFELVRQHPTIAWGSFALFMLALALMAVRRWRATPAGEPLAPEPPGRGALGGERE